MLRGEIANDRVGFAHDAIPVDDDGDLTRKIQPEEEHRQHDPRG